MQYEAAVIIMSACSNETTFITVVPWEKVRMQLSVHKKNQQLSTKKTQKTMRTFCSCHKSSVIWGEHSLLTPTLTPFNSTPFPCLWGKPRCGEDEERLYLSPSAGQPRHVASGGGKEATRLCPPPLPFHFPPSSFSSTSGPSTPPLHRETESIALRSKRWRTHWLLGPADCPFPVCLLCWRAGSFSPVLMSATFIYFFNLKKPNQSCTFSMLSHLTQNRDQTSPNGHIYIISNKGKSPSIIKSRCCLAHL